MCESRRTEKAKQTETTRWGREEPTGKRKKKTKQGNGADPQTKRKGTGEGLKKAMREK
jgi:hypothetical protein